MDSCLFWHPVLQTAKCQVRSPVFFSGKHNTHKGNSLHAASVDLFCILLLELESGLHCGWAHKNSRDKAPGGCGSLCCLRTLSALLSSPFFAGSDLECYKEGEVDSRCLPGCNSGNSFGAVSHRCDA